MRKRNLTNPPEESARFGAAAAWRPPPRRSCASSRRGSEDTPRPHDRQEVDTIPRKPADTWRRRARDAAHAYPGLKAAERELREVRITARLDAIPGSGSPGRSTEAAALRELPRRERAQLEAVEKALRCMATLTNAEERLAVVRMVFFERRYTLAGAAMQIPCSTKTAQGWSDDFLLLIISYLWSGPWEAPRSPQEGRQRWKGIHPPEE